MRESKVKEERPEAFLLGLPMGYGLSSLTIIYKVSWYSGEQETLQGQTSEVTSLSRMVPALPTCGLCSCDTFVAVRESQHRHAHTLQMGTSTRALNQTQ